MLVFHVANLDRADRVVQLLEACLPFHLILFATTSDRSNWCDNHCCADSSNLSERSNFRIKINGTPLHGHAQIFCNLNQALVSHRWEHRCRVGCQIPIVMGDRDEIRCVELFYVALVLRVKVQTDGKPLFLGIQARLDVCAIITCNFDVSNALWCSSVVVFHDFGRDSCQSSCFVVRADRACHNTERELITWRYAQLVATSEHDRPKVHGTSASIRRQEIHITLDGTINCFLKHLQRHLWHG
mmetsp:Transcript_67973/g.125369  ORF Transcript_67973/g.125369 Transcript_67973/m.125369 type:complete len:242 (+) Transcript_67973:240-965(+)